MKKILTFLFAIGLTLTASAIPAKRGFVTVTNSDGTSFKISLYGDESFHFHVTEDGVPVRKNANGDWVKDERDVSALWKEANARRNAHRPQLAQKVRRAMKASRRGGVIADGHSTKKGLLVLVNFSDVKFVQNDAQTKAVFTQMVNAIGNPYGRNYGSVREYFRAQSYNHLDVEFDVVGPVTVSKTMKYYGENIDEYGRPTTEDGDDAHPDEMVIEALKQVDSEVNFADYDWDGDGEVENVYVTYAGYGEAVTGSDPNTIWPHQWQLALNSGRLTLDGVKINTYACGSELQGISGKVYEGIGTMCHEYSHCLGLPDFYDCDYKGHIDMAEWSLMSAGCNNNSGFTPCGYTSYERWYCDWLEPVELKEGCNVSGMKCIGDEPEAYIIYNDKNRNEYYMLANHQKKGWDSAQTGHGMMILHVNYSSSAWQGNTVNTGLNPRMSIIPADNELYKHDNYYYADAGDLWPGTKKNTALTDKSKPASTLYTTNTDGTKYMHKDITDITEAGGTISFTFMGGESKVAIPVATEASVVSPNSFTARWGAVNGAVSYNLILTETYDDAAADAEALREALLIGEDFSKFYTSQTASSDGTSDLSSQLDSYTYFPNWTGSKIFKGLFGAKLGTSSAKGFITTPTLGGNSGSLTVFVDACDWFNYSDYVNKGTYSPDGSSLDIILQDASGNDLGKQTVKLADFMEAYTGYASPDVLVTFTNVPATYKICVSTAAAKNRAYLMYFMAFDGAFTLEQIYSVFGSSEEAVKANTIALHRIQPKMTATFRGLRKKPVTTTQFFENIPQTSCTFSSLKPGATYAYRVQAVDAEGNKSAWSDEISVTLPTDQTAIRLVSAPERVSDGIIYDLSGRRYTSVETLTPGIYIRDGRKFLVK